MPLPRLGLVVQTRSAEDSRRRHLTLTAKGQRANRQRKGTVEAAVRRVADNTTAAELATAARVMNLLTENLAAE